jgi:hypothetical protein
LLLIRVKIRRLRPLNDLTFDLRAQRRSFATALYRGVGDLFMRKLIIVATALAFAASATPSFAGPCKDAKGKFIKCPPKPAAKCRLNGKFASCNTPGAKPM